MCSLRPKRSLYQLFPIRDNAAWQFYQKQMKSFGTVGELDFGEDRHNAENLLNEDENRVLLKVFRFFAASDLIVNERLFLSLFDEAPSSEWRAALTAQSFFETIHSETYAQLIDTLCPDENKKRALFNALETEPAIAAKRDWYLANSTGPYAQRCIVQLCVEGIHFSSSFAIIAWLRKRFPGKSVRAPQAQRLEPAPQAHWEPQGTTDHSTRFIRRDRRPGTRFNRSISIL